jgi:hypothetical protein
MIETYAFLTAFTVQILVMSVLIPFWFIRYVRMVSGRIPAERLAQLYPNVDVGRAQDRFLSQYRALTIGVAVLGLLLLGWLFIYLQRPDWRVGRVDVLITIYFMAAYLLPLLLFAWVGVRFNKQHLRTVPNGKRTAVLQRRRLFDFVSPVGVGLAALLYFLFIAFVLYLRQHPFKGFAGLINIVAVTLVYALNAAVVYFMLYGAKKTPFVTQESRLQSMGLTVKSSVYSCIVIVVYLALNFSLRMFGLKSWEPFALSVFFTICALVASIGFAAPLRKQEVSELRVTPAR